jgi:hypothetical protein
MRESPNLGAARVKHDQRLRCDRAPLVADHLHSWFRDGLKSQHGNARYKASS